MKFLMNKQSILNAQNLGRVEPLEYHGGGGGDKTTTTTPALNPEVQAMLKTARELHASGALGRIAGLTGDQRMGFDQNREAAGRQVGLERALGRDANVAYEDSQSRFRTDAALNRSADVAGGAGGLGGSRNAFNNAQIHQSGQADYNAAQEKRRMNALNVQGMGADRLGGVGTALQQQRQNELDSEATGLKRLGSSIRGNAPAGSTTTQTGGK